MECPYCKTENRDGVRYCGNCGKLMDSTAATTTGGGSGSGGSRSLTPGSRLQGGRYVIKKVLGEGGMGAALLATDIRLDSKPVVIKELISDHTDPTKRQEDVQNFKREMITSTPIDHPLIPNVTDHFQEGPRYFMVQEYIEGENLEERMDRLNAPMKEREVLGYASEVLDVLDYLAQQTPPVVHRDIKPANIIIGAKDRRAHLVDFGIARADVARNARRKQTSALGTPGYAPPEQYQGNADARSDLYALAATLHYLLTNRDPRNEQMFAYPPVRSLNRQLSPEIEQVLTRALEMNANLRYQSAVTMKQDIDEILLNRFGVSGNTGSYTMSTSGPIVIPKGPNAPTVASRPRPTPAGQTRPGQPPPVSQARSGQQPPPVSPPPRPRPVTPPPPSPFQPVGMRGQQQQARRQQTGSHVGRNFVLFVLAIVVISVIAYGAMNYLNGSKNVSFAPPTATPTLALPNGIGVVKAPDGEYIGISDGTFAFDTNRPDGNAKRQAADRLKAGDVAGAQSLWQSGLQQDTSDAEALIYLEDQRVLASGNPHVTFVVGTIISGDNVGVGHDDLQGAYVAQKEFNDSFRLPNSVQVRLLIANAGNVPTNATMVAQQIVQAAQHDKTIVGVMGWPFSSHTLNAVKILAAAGIPLVSETASSDLLTKISPYFFRV